MSSLPVTELADPPPPAVTEAAAALSRRVLEREGIAMFVALQDARPGRQLVVRDPGCLVEGERLAFLLDHYDRELATVESGPGIGDSSMGLEPAQSQARRTPAAVLIDVLAVLSDQHLHARAEPST